MVGIVSLAYLTVEGATPVEHIEAAARHGFDAAGLRFTGPKQRPLADPVIGNTKLLHKIAETCAATGVSVFDIEVITIDENFDASAFAPLIEAAAAVRAEYIQVVCEDEDHNRAVENFAALSELAKTYKTQLSLEFMQFRALRTLEEAVSIIRKSGANNAGVLIDVLHLDRSGGTKRSLQSIDPKVISYVQLCDAPARRPAEDALVDEARNNRLYPGEGELPLVDYLNALPPDVPVSLEVPHLHNCHARIDKRAQLCADATRKFFARHGISTENKRL